MGNVAIFNAIIILNLPIYQVYLFTDELIGWMESLSGFSLNQPSWIFPSLSRDVREPVCLSGPSRKTCFRVYWRLLVKEHCKNIGIPLEGFGLLLFWWYFASQLFLILKTSLLCIMEKLSGGGSVAVTASVSDKWQVALDIEDMTFDTGHFSFSSPFHSVFFWNLFFV